MKKETIGHTGRLEDRIIEFANLCIRVAESLPNSLAGRHYAGELIRSSSCMALNYGRIQSAESFNDFRYRIDVIRIELGESRITLKIIARKPLLTSYEVNSALAEVSALFSIFADQEKPKKNSFLRRCRDERGPLHRSYNQDSFL
ncbi:MAG: hypothetical protein WEC12_04785 [Balneolaceae bacterium]